MEIWNLEVTMIKLRPLLAVMVMILYFSVAGTSLPIQVYGGIAIGLVACVVFRRFWRKPIRPVIAKIFVVTSIPIVLVIIFVIGKDQSNAVYLWWVWGAFLMIGTEVAIGLGSDNDSRSSVQV